MINAKDLRIGNWVGGNFPDMIVKSINISDVGLEMPGAEADFFDENIESLQPIPLTAEILLACGFVKDTLNREYCLSDYFYIDQQFNVYYKEWEGSDDRGGPEPRCFRTITSLHQLQNLYFALIGTDLTYSPGEQK